MKAAAPKRSRRFLERALPDDVRDGIVGDLEELFQAKAEAWGPTRARLWYRGQVLSLSTRFAAERIRDGVSLRNSPLALDVKLGFRMLVKDPALTLVAGIAITVATAVGVGGSEFARDLLVPSLPLAEADRVVRLQHADTRAGGLSASTVYDLDRWRASASSLEEVGGAVTLEQGFVGDRGEVGSVSLARISASAFRITETAPLLGRFLLEADEHPEAPPVVVLGYEAWQTLLGGADPIGRTVQLGGNPATVVGVMPPRYGFPQSQNAWVPLKVEPGDLDPASAPRVALFGLLAPGATLESAQAELERLDAPLAAELPGVYGDLSPRVVGYLDRGAAGQTAMALQAARVLFIFLLVVVCSNVATLVFARTVAREREIAVRNSLGATRGRIVAQLFAEALVLVGGATILGLLIASVGIGHVGRVFFLIQQEPQPPFWWDDGLSPFTLVYAGLLALVGAVMIGVVPALRATRGTLQPRLGQSGSALRFGGMWTVVVVLQVALAVAFLPLAVSQAGAAFEDPVSTDFPAEEIVTAQLGRDPLVPPRTPEERDAFLAESARLFEEVRDRLASDPGVAQVGLASGLSAMNHVLTPVQFVGDREPGAGTAGEAGGSGSTSGEPGEGSDPSVTTAFVRTLLVDPGYLPMMEATPVSGRALGAADFAPGARSVVVNEALAQQLGGGRNMVGGQLRFPDRQGEGSAVQVPEPGTTLDIVGVVRDPGIDQFGPGAHPALYAPLGLAPATPRDVGLVGMPQAPATQLFVRMTPGAGSPTARLHALVASVDPGLRLSELATVAEAWRPVHEGAKIAAWALMAVAGIVLMLSVAGIYALMSFTVSRRSREIAIRTAVGAGGGQIVGIIFRRAFLQLLAGVALGSLVAVPVLWDGVVDEGPRSLIIVSALLLGAGLTACLVPVRRALAIPPAAAMKAE